MDRVNVTLPNRLMEGGIAKLARGIYIRSAIEQSINLLPIPSNRSYIERMLARETHLVYIGQVNFTERCQVVLFIPL